MQDRRYAGQNIEGLDWNNIRRKLRVSPTNTEGINGDKKIQNNVQF